MQRFFVRNEQIQTNKITLTDKNVNYIKNVLRCNIGERIEICSQDGIIYLCEIEEITKEYVLCNILEELKNNSEPNVYINLIQGLPKVDKFEWIIEKGTELGVKEITPLKTSRCVVKLDGKEELKKVERWRKIALSASEQSKRNIIPTINNIYNMNNVFNLLQNYDIVLLAYENERNISLKDELKNIEIKSNFKIAVIVGPEGGFEETEVELFKEKGKAKSVSLGKRILRTETAGMSIISNIMYEFE